MKLDKGISKSVQKEIDALIEKDNQHRLEVYARFRRLRKYKREKKYSEMRMFHSIIGCVKCY